MAKRGSIMLNGKYLHEFSIDEIVDIASHPLRKRFDLTEVGPLYQNRAVIKAFGGKSERTTSELIAKFPGAAEDWSEQFNALRAGEALGWALQEGIVERLHQHLWRLVHDQQQFERIGRGVRQRAIRIHNAGAAQAENNKLWAKELKQRERRRLKAMAEMKPVIQQAIALICRCAPGHDISAVPVIERFAVGGFKSIAACRELIEQSIDEMDANELYDLSSTLARICRQLDIDHRRNPAPQQASPEALAELQDFSL